MDKERFVQYVERTRDCDAALLDIAVRKGLHRAKSDSLDWKKLLRLAAACAATVVLCITVNTGPFKAAAERYRRERSLPQGSTEALEIYARDVADTLIKYLGDG